jgi:hypothetical protein
MIGSDVEVGRSGARGGKAAVDGNGRGGGAYKARPRGLGRPTKRSVTFIVFAVLLVLGAIVVALAVLFP